MIYSAKVSKIAHYHRHVLALINEAVLRAHRWPRPVLRFPQLEILRLRLQRVSLRLLVKSFHRGLLAHRRRQTRFLQGVRAKNEMDHSAGWVRDVFLHVA